MKIASSITFDDEYKILKTESRIMAFQKSFYNNNLF